MSIAVTVVLTTVGILLGAGFATLAARSRTAVLAERKALLEQELASSRSELEKKAGETSALLTARASLEATLASERRNTEEKLALLAQSGEELKRQFQALASSALESNNNNFLELARSTLEKQQAEAKGELEKREKAVEVMVKPISDSLKQMDEQVRHLERSRAEAYGTLTSQVSSLLETQKALQTETGNLVKAMREPQARGRWGELQLRKVIELAGMLEYCDFEEQVSVTTDERRLRPDVVVRLPGRKTIVIDSKAPLAAYLSALEAKDEATRAAFLVDHARQTRQHIQNLGSKSYWASFGETPEFVVLFLPGEVFFRAAMDVDAELIEYGVAHKVILASPTTLIALLKAVAYGWNQQSLAERALEISTAGRQLYERLCTMTGHVDTMGKRLDGAVKAYNDMLSSLEKRVFPVARKFPEMDRSLASGNDVLDQIEKLPRQLEASDWLEEPTQTRLPLNGEQVESAKG